MPRRDWPKTHTVGVKLVESDLATLDALVQITGFANRSDAVRVAIRIVHQLARVDAIDLEPGVFDALNRIRTRTGMNGAAVLAKLLASAPPITATGEIALPDDLRGADDVVSIREAYERGYLDGSTHLPDED